MKKFLFLFIFLSVSFISSSQNNFIKERPKLVVGIVVDQMRYDYLIRYYEKYGNGGFKRLLNNGFNCENAHYNYIPTYTAVGHASIYTGTTPDIHGIISNNWYDRSLKRSIYCVDDSNYKTVGASEGGNKSPYRLKTTTITDQLRLAQNMNGKTISISIKDRSAILPGGHTANMAFWFEGGNVGKFISSTFYREKLPDWAEDFNHSKSVKNYMKRTWNTMYDIDTYTESIADDNEYEEPFKGDEKVVFPYKMSKLAKNNNNFSMIKSTPFGNSIVVDFAEKAVIGEKLGRGKFTDFLAISFSSPDYIGHQFGVNSVEIEDTYLRLDKDLERFLIFLDKKIGKDNYILFLTADHAAVQVPAYLNSLKIPGGYFDMKDFKKFIAEITKKHFNSTELIEDLSNYQIYLNRSKISELGLEKNKVAEILADEIINYNGVLKTVTGHTLQNAKFNDGILNKLQNGYNQKLSGDILIVPEPTMISYSKVGSTHGSGFSHDTHVPMIFYGKGVRKGSTDSFVPITALAPTISDLLQIEFPNGSLDEIIEMVD